MQLSICLVRKYSQSGKSIQVILDDKRTLLWVPRWALLHDYQPGERNIVIECRYGAWAEEWERESFLKMMEEQS